MVVPCVAAVEVHYGAASPHQSLGMRAAWCVQLRQTITTQDELLKYAKDKVRRSLCARVYSRTLVALCN